MRKWIMAAAAAALFVPAAAGAIIMRHDVPDVAYRALGERYRMTVVGVALLRKDGTPNHGNGVGTLVAPDWVLTAAHVAAHVKPGHKVWVNGGPFAVEKVIVHPKRGPETPWFDIALLKLERKVPGAQPACLYPLRDEVGQVSILVGNGRSGTGLTGPVDNAPVWRGATARIEGTEAGEVAIWWPFRAPDDPRVTPMEGISGPGDSGGPAFLRHRGKLCIAGVSSAQDNRGLGNGRYTVKEYYPRVSWFRPWILETMAKG